MAYPEYSSLSSDKRLEIWQQLKESAGWQYLFEDFLKELSVKTKPIDRDSKLKWEYESVRAQVIAELMTIPDQHITGIQLSPRRKTDQVNNEPIKTT